MQHKKGPWPHTTSGVFEFHDKMKLIMQLNMKNLRGAGVVWFSWMIIEMLP